MKKPVAPVIKDLVLVGGGHAHVGVLRYFAMHPVPGLRITLIARDIYAPYSGMLPGLVAGHYSYDACHIDLMPLARFASARLYHASAVGLDLVNKQVLLQDRPAVPYDILSINIGSTPAMQQVPGAHGYAIAVKPIDQFLSAWQQLQQRIAQHQGQFQLAVVGAGAGGVELALAMQYALSAYAPNISLYTAGKEVLETHVPSVRKRLLGVLAARQISVQVHTEIAQVDQDAIQDSQGNRYACDAVVWTTHASAAGWLEDTGLALDSQGFIQVNRYLQSLSHPDVFAVGDIAAMETPRPKSGVFAVRQGRLLAKNLRAYATGRSLKPYRAQKHFLSLISTGDKHAIASRNFIALQGRWVWYWKDHIDQKFMRRFNQLPTFAEEDLPKVAQGLADQQAMQALSRMPMRCGGCGAKVGAGLLTRVLQRLPDVPQADDAALLQVPTDHLLLQSVDYFRAFTDDAYVFGAIAANHALSDLYAMGAQAHSALALASIPYAREAVVEQTLYEVLKGASDTLGQSGAKLLGGHSSEGAELAFGLSVNGLVKANACWAKQGLQVGDALVLTKPLGTGTLLAADMRGKAKGRWVDNALQQMMLSNQQAQAVLMQHTVHACTDITGFGLLGHLLEMMQATPVAVQLAWDALPLLDGALNTTKMGIVSSMQESNLRARRALADFAEASQHAYYPLLFDPQTAGGLLAAIPQAEADACVSALQQQGYALASVVGHVIAPKGAQDGVKIYAR